MTKDCTTCAYEGAPKESAKCHGCGAATMFQNWESVDGLHCKADDMQIGGDHYMNMAVEPWDVVDTWPLEQRIGAYRHGALKYLMRMGSKDAAAQEVREAGHYCQKLAEVLEETTTA